MTAGLNVEITANTQQDGTKYLISAKKRPRSPSEDCEECLPISKRINRLHIESSRQSINGTGTNQATSPIFTPKTDDLCSPTFPVPCGANIDGQSGAMPSVLSNNNIMPNNSSNSSCVACSSEQSAMLYQELIEGYKPELGETDNPEYYSINRVLFEVHVERAKRLRINYSNS